MKKEIKTIYCDGYYPCHNFAWEGSIILYDNQYFEGIVRELSVSKNSESKITITRMDEKDQPEGFIAGYIIDDKVITFDKFPEANTPFDNIAFLSSFYENFQIGRYFSGRFAPIMPRGDCPHFYKSLYHNKDTGLNVDLFDEIKDLFPCEDDEIILLGEKRKSKMPKGLGYTSPLNSKLEYTVNSTPNDEDMGFFNLDIGIESKIRNPEDIILDEQELEQKIEAFKDNMREFDIYLYKNISENKEEKYNRILERLVKNGIIKEKLQDENYVEEEPREWDENYIEEEPQEDGCPKRRIAKIKDRIKRVFKK